MTAAEYRAIRKSIGTQEKVASMLGVAKNTVARRERGELPIDGEAALAIQRVAEGADDPNIEGGS